MVDVPLDILYLIVDQVGKTHPLSYTIRTASLHALCLVSRSFNALATPVLYSSITLSSQRMAGCLVTTATSSPWLLQWCHSLCWPGFREPFVEAKLLSTMTGLRRYATSRMMSPAQLDLCRTNSSMTELAFPETSLQSLCTFDYCIFPNLERLVIRSAPFSKKAPTIDNFLKMPRLTHVAITNFDGHLYAGSAHLDIIVSVITHTAQLQRVIFGLTQTDGRGFRSSILERLPEHCAVQVVCWSRPDIVRQRGDKWFRSRIVDGTLWEIDSMVCPEEQVEVY